ncbi:MAG TPA: ThiF family adenylyltransferase [Stellaceae bacterium]|nr:ThiF family adenylyltransferase [Stellaceae bacterium]
MSRRPIALSPALLRLQNEGYDLDIRHGFLLVRDVPFVDSQRVVRRGILISKLKLSGDIAEKPDDHVCYWTGEHPCHADGAKVTSIQNPSAPQDLAPGVRADFTFSAKADYRDYHHKMTTYIGRISGEAAKVDPNVTACTFPVIPADDEDSIFKYVDTATSRAGIGMVNAKLARLRIGIAGVGGSGAYILDFVAKTSVAQIHVFDRDVFSQHNAFRSPGAPSIEELRAKPQKVVRFAEIYSNIRRGIIVHDVFLEPSNVALLDGLDFVFVCMDVGSAKRAVIERLIDNGTPFIDVGMGVVLEDGQLSGIVRTTTSTADTRTSAAPHISFAEGDVGANDYSSNIQIAELNALNAAIAVIRWKKLFGVYRDARKEVYAGYSIASGEMVVEGAI